MTPIRSIILSLDEWVDGQDLGATVDAPDEETVRDAIHALDGACRTTVSLHVMGKEETCWMVIARSETHPPLVISATLDGEQQLVARGVDEPGATRAALYFLDFGRLDPRTPWQPLEE